MVIDKITIYKIKSDVSDKKEFLKVDDLREVELPLDIECEDSVKAWACMKVHGAVEKTQDNFAWLTFFNDGLPEGKKFSFKTKNSFPAGLLVLSFENAVGKCSFYVLTFGLGGDNLIDHDFVMRDFGLRVAMNICDPDNLKRIQTSIHESISTQSERQISVGSSFSVFNIDDEKEFLRTLAGAARKEFSFIQSFTGRDSIVIKAAKDKAHTWKSLVERVEMLGKAHELENFKSQFPGYAKFHFENDPVTIAALDGILFDKVKAGQLDGVHLASPEVLDFGAVEFSYGHNKERFDDLVLSEALASRRAFGDKSSIDSIKGIQVNVWNVDATTKIRKWTCYKCLVAEIEYNEDSFILSAGQWKRVGKELREEVTEYLLAVSINDEPFLLSNVRIWDAAKKKDREAVFNLAVDQSDDGVVLFDTAKIEIAGQRYYETCDILHRDGKFIQVKRYSSGSASVSHLFVQGRFYAEAFFSDENCRLGMRKHIEDTLNDSSKDDFLNLIPKERKEIIPNKYAVVFCILSASNAMDVKDLPFMAQYELMHTHRHLSNVFGIGCEVAFRQVLTGEAPPSTTP